MNAPSRSKQGAVAAVGSVTDVMYPLLIRILTGALILALCLWIGAGIVNVLFRLTEAFAQSWAVVAEHTIINALIMLALLEVIRTLQVYLKLGRVRVTFILDTALVILITELMGVWFREYSPEKVLLGLGVIVTLVALRIVTARFSPEWHGDPRRGPVPDPREKNPIGSPPRRESAGDPGGEPRVFPGKHYR